MTDDIRDRLAEWIETHRSYDPESFGTIVESLAALVGEMLLAERAAALGAAGDVVTTCRRCGCSLIASGLPHCEDRCSEEDVEPEPLDHAIRSISPEGWRGVREADLAVLKEAAHEALAHFYAPLEELQQYRDRADEIRAALARMP